MNLKLTPIFFIFGLFIFKVGVFDSFRNMGHHNNSTSREPTSEKIKFLGIR